MTRRWLFTGLLAAATASLGGAPRRALADDATAPASSAVVRTLALPECMQRALANHPNIGAAQARLRNMRAQLDEARTAPFSQFTATAGIGPAPTARGNDFYSPNTEVSLSSNLGLAWRVGVEGLVPLWTFGKIDNLVDAAIAQTRVGEADVAKQRNQTRLDVRKAFYGLQLARDGIAVLDDARKKLDKALEKLDESVAEGNTDEIDSLRLHTFRYELDGRRAEAGRYEAIALASLRFLTGDPAMDIPSEPLRLTKRQLAPAVRYLEAARLSRPEVNMVRAGIVARAAQVELARAKLYPDVGVGLSAVWSRAPEVADQLNPFVRDDANYFHYGFALALRWQLDFVPGLARVRQAEAQLEELRETERYALGGVGVEVETAYAQIKDAMARERAYGQAEHTAKRWMIAVQQGIDVGTKEESDLVDPARQFATQRFSHLQAMMDVDMAWAQMAIATGDDQFGPE